eukprot:scaffold3893_cov89-Skeletonema_dohrnii-CCMP3373.AAC.1
MVLSEKKKQSAHVASIVLIIALEKLLDRQFPILIPCTYSKTLAMKMCIALVIYDKKAPVVEINQKFDNN